MSAVQLCERRRNPTRLATGLVACVLAGHALIGCAESADAAAAPLRFDVRPVAPERSAVYAVRASRTPEGVVVRGGFFVGAPERRLEARVVRLGAAASRLEISAVPAGAGTATPTAAHYDYEAALPAAISRDLTVVHVRVGAAADTVFRGRVF